MNLIENDKESKNMDSNSLNATEIAVGSLLANRGGYGNYGGAWGGGTGMMYAGNSVLAADAHANGTATKTAIDCHAAQFNAGLDRVSDQNEETRRLNSFDSIRDNQFQSELRNSDRLRDLERILIEGQREAAKCCCDTQKEIAESKAALLLQSCEDKNQILAAISDQKSTALAIESRNIERNLNAANAELTALKTQIACNCNCPPHPCPHPVG